MPPDPGVTRFAKVRCPKCRYLMNAAGTPDGSPGVPQLGDLVACIRCGAVMFWGETGPRGMTEREMADLVADPITMHRLALLVRKIHLLRQVQ